MSRIQVPRAAVIEVLLFVYKRVFSPLLHVAGPAGGGCPYQPTCSDYAALACSEHGWLRGGALAGWRLLRCNPLSRGGWDPVPERNCRRHQNSITQ